MKKITLIFMLSLLANFTFAQKKLDAEKIVDEGVAYHDKGDYEGAIRKYDQALELDKNNLLALAEKAFSLLSMERYDETIQICKLAISSHPKDEDLKSVYVTYGNALDGLKKTDQSIEVYNSGLALFPSYYQLHFNKGITLASIRKYDDAIKCFQLALKQNPKHASSHNAIARLTYNTKRIPSILAYSRFLTIEPQTNRAKENLVSLKKQMLGNVKETGNNAITINVSSDLLGDTLPNGKPKENNFSSAELILSMDAALDFDAKNKSKTDVEKFIRKFETLCATLSETKKLNHGFYWDFYVPYFVEMKEKKMIETFAYIAFASSDDEYIGKWLKAHEKETDAFFEWTKLYQWNTK